MGKRGQERADRSAEAAEVRQELVRRSMVLRDWQRPRSPRQRQRSWWRLSGDLCELVGHDVPGTEAQFEQSAESLTGRVIQDRLNQAIATHVPFGDHRRVHQSLGTRACRSDL